MDNSDKQRRKLIQAILNRNPKILGQDDAKLSQEEEIRFYDLVNKSLVKHSDADRIIASIKGPVDSVGIDAIFAKISASNYERRILAYMSGVGFDNYEHTRPQTINDFLEKYPNPMDFQSAKDDFLAAVKHSNPVEKYGAYLIAMKDFCAHIYGKKQEYDNIAKKLFIEAEEWRVDQDAKRLESELLPHAEIDGDDWKQGGQNYKLRPELLLKAGLGPRYELEIGGVQIALSRVFLVDTYEAAIAYINFGNAVKIRGYYRSNSQGMWRFLADYVGGDGVISWYGVGFNEESLTLPLKIQKQLNEICKKGAFKIPGANTAFFLGGTARRFNSKEEYKQLVANNKMDSDYYREVNHQPAVDFGVLSTKKHPPESIDVDNGNAPNFHTQLDHYRMETRMYGTVTVRQFASNNDNLRYTIFEIGEGNNRRAWIGGIEVNAPITSTGLKSEWVSSGDICTPLLEYQTMTGGYGNPAGRTDGYEDMWEYIRRMPIIKRFLYTWRSDESQ
ncbi:hypothetical protein IJG79_02365 [Candidatus Saccharibacteria bacterium]|nr:hypothetical protein [Candidatus Saccharibacteria bacterium]